MSADTSKLDHLFRMVTMMQSREAGDAEQLARKLSVSERTIYRYLNSLKNIGIPCFLDEESGCYCIHKDCFLPPLHLTAGETLALVSLVQQVAGREQIALTGPASRAVEKIRAQLPQGVRDDLGDVDQHVAIRLPPTGPAGDAIVDVFDPIRKAIAERRAVLCRYESLNAETDGNELFVLKPYALIFDQRAWYVIGHHGGRNEVRRLKLNRFTSIEATDLPYAIPDDFSVDSYRGNAWRMIRGDKTYSVRIHFDATMAETVSDTHWHPTQDIEDHEDGSITFRCAVEGLDEIVWWVLSYGPAAKVLDPPELAKLVAELAEATAAKYVRTRMQEHGRTADLL